jgi:hypothetical protein
MTIPAKHDTLPGDFFRRSSIPAIQHCKYLSYTGTLGGTDIPAAG